MRTRLAWAIPRRVILGAAVLLCAGGCAESDSGSSVAATERPASTTPNRTPAAAPTSSAAASTTEVAEAPEAMEQAPARIVVSLVGDCTLGGPYALGAVFGSFAAELAAHDGDRGWFFGGVRDVLASDDLTIANLEMTFAAPDASPVPGKARFRGPAEYVEMLVDGSVELVNVANNHTYDFGESGYQDTLDVVRRAGVGITGNGIVDRRVVAGVPITNLGFTAGDARSTDAILRAIRREKRDGELLFVSLHWGNEYVNAPNDVQRKLGPAAIDAGADLVIGTHPHVLQGIETYKGRHIVYSLGDLVFGGDSDPADKDAMIVQEVFEVRPAGAVPVETRVLPIRISSVAGRNDFRPTLLEGEDAARVRGRVAAYSAAIAKARQGAAR